MNLRPLGIGELLDAAMKVCTANFRTLIRISLFVVLPAQLISAIVLASTMPEDWTANTWDFSAQDDETISDDDAWTLIAGQLVSLAVVVVMQMLATAACFRAIAQAWLGNEPDWRESLKFGVRSAPGLLWVTILVGLATLAGTIACLIPGIWLYVLFAVAMPVLLVEGTGGRKALGRSKRLVEGRWWATFGALMLGFLLAGLLTFVADLAVSLPLFLVVDDSSLAGHLVTALGQGLGYLIALPLQAAITALIYFDLRVRKEGFDLQVLAQRIGTEAPAQSGTDPFGRPLQPQAYAPPPPRPAAWPRQEPEPPQEWEEQREWQPPAGWEPPEPGR